MTIFLLVAVLLVLASLLFIIPPLLGKTHGTGVQRQALNVSIYKDQFIELERDLQNDVLNEEQYQLGRQELERRLLVDVEEQEQGAAVSPLAPAARRTALAIAVILPLAALGLYAKLGNLEGLSPESYQPPELSQTEMSDQINAMIEQLAARLQDTPSDGEGWKMLGRSYLVQERFADARDAFEKAAALLADDAQLLADLADTIAMTSGQSLEGRPLQLINQALAIDPTHQKSLWLAGTAAYERQDYRQALNYWQRLAALMPPGSEGAQAMARNIAEIQGLLGEPAAMAPPQPAQANESISAGKVSGVVRLAAALSSRITADQTVFIFAQATSGPRMPLAVQQIKASELPFMFALDDSMAMMPEMSLSRVAEVVITARITASGNASPQSGDLQGRSVAVSSDNSMDVDVLISEIIP